MRSCIKFTILGALLVSILSLAFVWFVFQVKVEGELRLANMKGKEAKIIREKDTMITHIRGENLEQAIYAQGFAHAQTRLWNLEKIRRVSKGEIAELFGPELLPIDKFMRSIDIKGHAAKEWENMSPENRSLLEAYSDGINDFVAGVSLFGD